MSYSFNDDTYDRIYKSEARSGKLFTVFAILAIAISCLGLLGLTTFNVTNRTKEIGIRKVLGSSEFGIVSLLSKEFLSLIVIAFALATPLAWVISRQWLDGFASRISPSLWIYLGAGSAVILLGMITIGFQTLRAARINPSETLMTE